MSTPHARRCIVCEGSEWTLRLVTTERMLGLGGVWEYAECARCGCLQLVTPVTQPEALYPPGYYAFAGARSRRGPRRLLRRVRNAGVFGRHPAGRMLARTFPHPVAGAERWLERAQVNRAARILDVGCGRGDLLHDLADAGYSELLGIDPFAPASAPDDDPPIHRFTIEELAASSVARFDLVMFHHALEHMDDQIAAMRAAATLLAPGGTVLVRVPLASSWAWRHYREHWVQLDAPRHVALHTPESIRLLAERAGLTVTATDFDSTAFQFGGSELYRRGERLDDDWPRHFTKDEMRDFTARARQLNATGEGDQAAFYLRRT